MGLYKRRLKDGSVSGVWWYRFEVAGKEIRGSTRTSDRRKAEIEERRQRAYYESRAPHHRASGSVTIADLAGLDCEHVSAKGTTPKRMRDVEQEWTRLCAFFGALEHPREITYDRVMQYIAHRRQAGTRGQSIVRDIQALKRGLKTAHRNGWLPLLLEEWPTVRRDPKKAEQAGKLHPPAVLARWLGELTEDARDEATVALLTGLRERELKRLTAHWVEPAPSGTGVPAFLRVPASCSKTRNERVIGLVHEALAVLVRRAQAVGRDAPLFPVGCHKTTHRAAARRIKYPHAITLRDLRHCYATWAAQGTGDAAAAQAALGHTNLATTQRYLSSTLTRTASASIAVLDAIGRHSLPGTVDCVEVSSLGKSNEIREVDGAKKGTRTLDLLITNQTNDIAAHVTSCFHCASIVRACIESAAVGTSRRHSESAQTPRKGVA